MKIILLVTSLITLFTYGQEKTTFSFLNKYTHTDYYEDIEVITTIEKALLNTDKVKAVKIAANSKKLDEISKLTQLKYLYLDETFTSVSFYLTEEKIIRFFKIISELPDLKYISIYDGKLLKYFDHLQNINGVKINKVENFNDYAFIDKLQNVELLIINDPFISFLPASIGQLKNLVQLELYNTNVQRFPDLSGLNKLKVLKTNLGKIDKTHNSLEKLKELKYLSINGLTNFKIFPEEICGLNSLEELYIELRNAQPLSDCIGNLTNLKILHLYDCQKIYEFPTSISKLTNLEEIYLGDAPEHIQLENLNNLPKPFVLILNRCNYVGISKQLNTIPKLKQLIIPSTILPKELKKIQEAIFSEKVVVKEF